MALRTDPVRLLIADDVGVGKTIEALLITRELWDRGEIRRLCVLCPPSLCDQWQRELTEKFNLDATVIRSGTIGHLERSVPLSRSIFEYYPVQVVSIDWVKSDRNRHGFLLHCPELVIVDEAHGATPATGQSQQQRYELVRDVASDPNRHLILLTATPHSGIAAAFRALLGLLRPEFSTWDVGQITDSQRDILARHFVQRTRRDIEQVWENVQCFPKRELLDETYLLSPTYRELCQQTYDLCSRIVHAGNTLRRPQRLARAWGALELLRCIMSSPEAALATLRARTDRSSEDVSDVSEEAAAETPMLDGEEASDEIPVAALGSLHSALIENDRHVRRLTKLAEQIRDDGQDTKLRGCVRLVERLLREGFAPIVWCHYIATAEYVASGLKDALRSTYPQASVTCVTGRQAEDERRELIARIDAGGPRVLVATDCLSEGINLQEKFNAAVHYDLPWNPNRLEQREGRVDRYGQTAQRVKTIRYFSPDNPIDGKLLTILLDKAREIHRALGTYVPVPVEDKSVTRAMLNALFLDGQDAGQLQLRLDLEAQTSSDNEDAPVDATLDIPALHRRWDEEVERERLTRTRFAQRTLRPEEVQRELEATDAVLGDPTAVRAFVQAGAELLGLHMEAHPKRAEVYRIAISAEATEALPQVVRDTLPQKSDKWWLVSFVSPTPQDAEYLGRNHRFVAAMAQYLIEEALRRPGKARASRCGVMRTLAVQRLTTIFLLRVRYLVALPDKTPMLAEEVQVVAYAGFDGGVPRWLETSDAVRLLGESQPAGNIPMSEKRDLIGIALNEWEALQQAVSDRLAARAADLERAYKRVRQAAQLRVRELAVTPQLPPDLLGILVLQPVVVP
jgi:superfamily II DNA or RNA helicase